MPKKSKGMGKSYQKFETYDSGYYEPFAGRYNSDMDQGKYWNMVKAQKGVIPGQFMEMSLPMANDVGKKGEGSDSYGPY